jgi:uncharacterized Fe-S radical SAM superfamily protein PflX
LDWNIIFGSQNKLCVFCKIWSVRHTGKLKAGMGWIDAERLSEVAKEKNNIGFFYNFAP